MEQQQKNKNNCMCRIYLWLQYSTARLILALHPHAEDNEKDVPAYKLLGVV